jgi:chemotaxis family two-component system response regulator Rcp1
MVRQMNILLVEDNEGDILLAKEALKQGRIPSSVNVARDGEEALNYLHKRADFAEVSVPDLILLDINLPKIDGKEVLSEIKTDRSLRYIPVVMLTTSSAESDVMDAYYHHANCYIVKPVDLDKFLEVVHRIENFWLSIVKLPNLN